MIQDIDLILCSNTCIFDDNSNCVYIYGQYTNSFYDILIQGINEFLLDTKNKIFRWSENTVGGGIAEYKCSKILAE